MRLNDCYLKISIYLCLCVGISTWKQMPLEGPQTEAAKLLKPPLQLWLLFKTNKQTTQPLCHTTPQGRDVNSQKKQYVYECVKGHNHDYE